MKRFLAVGSVAMLTLVGCGPSFRATMFSSDDSNNGSSKAGTTPISDFKALVVEGTVSGGAYGSNPVVGLDKQRMELIVLFPISITPHLDPGVTQVSIATVSGASFQMESAPDGTPVLALRVPLDHVVHGVSLPSGRLPNGEPVPGVAGGQLPMTPSPLTSSNDVATVYLAPSYVGVYINAADDPGLATTLPVRNRDRTRTWGQLTTFPQKWGVAGGGYYLAIELPDDVTRIIESVL